MINLKIESHIRLAELLIASEQEEVADMVRYLERDGDKVQPSLVEALRAGFHKGWRSAVSMIQLHSIDMTDSE